MVQKKTMGLRRNLREKERRDAIVQSAIKVFSRMGYQRATMEDLVSEAGCSKALIYLYWKNKAELFSYLIELSGKQNSDLFQAALDSPEPFPEKIAKLLPEFIKIFKDTADLNKVTLRGSMHIGNTPEEDFKSKVDAVYSGYIKTLSALFQQGIEQGYLDPDQDIEALAFMGVAAVTGYISMSLFSTQISPERAFLDTMNRYILSMMLKQDRKNDKSK